MAAWKHPSTRPEPTPLRAVEAEPRRTFLWEAAVVVLLTAAAAAARVYGLDRYPPGFQGDEGWIGLEAQRILTEGGIGVWSPTAWGQPAGPIYWTAFLFTFLPDTITTLRLSTALLGIVAVPAFYLFARSFFDWRVAMAGAALLAFSYWHIHYSRTAYPLIAVPLVVCAVLACFAKGVQTRGWGWFLAAGALAGLGVHTYRGYAFFVIPLAVAWGAVFLSGGQDRRLLVRNALIFAGAALIVAAPFLAFVATHRYDYFNYSEITSIFKSQPYKDAIEGGDRWSFLWDQVWRAGSSYFVAREADITDGLGTRGLLGPIGAGLFAVGVGVSLWRWRDWRYTVLLAGLVAGVVAVATTVEPGENRRGIGALPLVFAAAGIGASALLGLGSKALAAFPRAQRAVGWTAPYAVLAWVLMLSAGWNLHSYFQRMMPSDGMRFAYAVELRDVVDRLRTIEPAPYVYFYSDRWSWDYEARRFMAPDLEGENRSRVFGEFRTDRDLDRGPVAFVLMPEYINVLDELKARYPHGAAHEEWSGSALVYALFLVDGPVPPPSAPPEETVSSQDNGALSVQDGTAYNVGLSAPPEPVSGG